MRTTADSRIRENSEISICALYITYGSLYSIYIIYDERVSIVLSIDIQIGMHFYAREAALWLLSHFATVIRSHSLASTDRLSLCRFALPKLHGRKDLGF